MATAMMMEDGETLGKSLSLAEGKTKKIFQVAGVPECVRIVSKDDITAFNMKRHASIEGKGQLCNALTCGIFEFLRLCGIDSHYMQKLDNYSFMARKLQMIPIEFVARRVATGSFLTRNPGVPENTVFRPLLLETFLKDDAKSDPLITQEQILASDKFGLTRPQLNMMLETLKAVFEALELLWRESDCVLVDMKIEFGFDAGGAIWLGDVIDNDSWRLWPRGDKKHMKDKQLFRNATEINDEVVKNVHECYGWVNKAFDKAAGMTPQMTMSENGGTTANRVVVNLRKRSRVVIIMGSAADLAFCRDSIATPLATKYGIDATLRVCSAHKATSESLQLLAEFEYDCGVIIACAGRSNGLGAVLAGNSELPLINCPPPSLSAHQVNDIWSSLHVPSGIGSTTVIGGECAALAAAKIIAQHDGVVAARLRGHRFANVKKIFLADNAALKEDIRVPMAQ